MSIEMAVTWQRGTFTLDVAFTSAAHLLGISGVSGSGKTTLLNILAGLARPPIAFVKVGSTVFVDTERGVFLPVQRRRVGYVFQEGRLFPHLTVRQNLLYGRYFTPAAERRIEPATVIDVLGIRALLDRKPRGLSGGEQQRVAIGRALLLSPSVLLLDEPLSSLDEARKQEVLPYIEALRDEFRMPIVYVSHAPAELARLADEIIEISGGKIAGSRVRDFGDAVSPSLTS